MTGKGKGNIPKYNIRAGDKGYPGVQESHERDPGGNAIADATEVFSGLLYPSDAYDVMGGGVEAPSLDDAITANPVGGHDNEPGPVTDWHEQAASLDILHDEEYGYAGLSGKAPLAEPTDPEGDAHNLQAFADSSYKGVQLTRDVATAANYNTFNIVAGNDAIPILGENWARRSARVRSLATNTVNVLLGSQNALGSTVGAGAFVLEPGKEVTIQNTDSLQCVTVAGIAGNAVVSVIDEQYER